METILFQYRKRYGLHAIGKILDRPRQIEEFQYRKRYGLHAIAMQDSMGWMKSVSIPQAVWIACNTKVRPVAFLFAVFQYRKRYGLHAIPDPYLAGPMLLCFNTASGMDCMQCAPLRH